MKLKWKTAEQIRNAERWKWRLMIGTPTLGTVRIEWHNATTSLIMPMNFSAATVYYPIGMLTPIGYHVAEAQNCIVKAAIDSNVKWEWLLFLEDDVVPPPHLFTRLSQWIEHDTYPVVSGLYHLKAQPPEPMTFRGRGNGSYEGWQKGPTAIEKKANLPPSVKPSEVCFCDGVPTGCLLISTKLLRVAWDESPPIVVKQEKSDGTVAEIATREVFRTMREAGIDPESGGYFRKMGTSDLDFCDRAIDGGWIKMAGYPEAAKKKYPFPVDLTISCGHIDLDGAIF